MKVNNVQFGISTRCCSSCYFCLRQILQRSGIPQQEEDLSIDIIKKVLNNKDIHTIRLCGNRGEALFHPHIDEILKEIKVQNKTLFFHTNGCRFKPEWWYNLAKTFGNKDYTVFAIDGLKKAHEIYRNTNFNIVFENMVSFINGGGNAIWQMILFKHNEHEVEAIKKISKKIGCKLLQIRNSRQYNNIYKKPEKKFSLSELDFLRSEKFLEKQEKVECMFGMGNSVYIDVRGQVWPCWQIRCFYGFGNMDQNNKFLKLANKEKYFLNAGNSNLDDIIEKSELFKEVFSNINNLKPCRLFCGNKNIWSKTRKFFK